jgi:hypothetical protein
MQVWMSEIISDNTDSKLITSSYCESKSSFPLVWKVSNKTHIWSDESSIMKNTDFTGVYGLRTTTDGEMDPTHFFRLFVSNEF